MRLENLSRILFNKSNNKCQANKPNQREREKEKIESLATNKEKHKYLRKMLPGKHLVTNPFSSNCKKFQQRQEKEEKKEIVKKKSK